MKSLIQRQMANGQINANRVRNTTFEKYRSYLLGNISYLDYQFKALAYDIASNYSYCEIWLCDALKCYHLLLSRLYATTYTIIPSMSSIERAELINFAQEYLRPNLETNSHITCALKKFVTSELDRFINSFIVLEFQKSSYD